MTKKVITLISRTLPFDIVMNGILYPKDEILANVPTMNVAACTLGHPEDEDGQFLSANQVTPGSEFFLPCAHRRAKIVNNAIQVEKVIVADGLPEALKTAINGLPDEPISTSVGVYLTLDDPPEGTGLLGIARDIVIDHDAILLNEAPAATPAQGVGIFSAKETAQNELDLDLLRERVREALDKPPFRIDWIESLTDTYVVFRSGDGLFKVDYTFGNNVVTIMGIPAPVRVAYVPLDTIGEDMSSESSPTSQQVSVSAEEIKTIIANALAPVSQKLGEIDDRVSSFEGRDIEEMAVLVGNSKKYPGLDVEAAKRLDRETLKKMAANCKTAYGINAGDPLGAGEDEAWEMPE